MLWLANNYVEDSTAYNVAFAWRLEGDLRIPKFEVALQDIARRHESLRTRHSMDPVAGEPCQSVLEAANISLEFKNSGYEN